MYKYKIFGLNIISDIELSELMPADGPIDVEINTGKVPECLNDSFKRNDTFQASKNEFLFMVKDIAKFYVVNGNKITIESFKDVPTASVKVFLLATAFCLLLLQRGILPIHGSALVVDGKGIIITGTSGAGKSTLSNALLNGGAAFLADDLSPLALHDDGSVWIQPGFPQQKLCEDTAQRAGVDTSTLTRVEVDLNKYILPVSDSFVNKSIKLATICELNITDKDTVSVTRLKGLDKLTVIINQTFKTKLMPFTNMGKEHFRLCAGISKSIQVFRLYRPENKFTTSEQIELLRKELSNT
jgi:hypothetical protein